MASVITFYQLPEEVPSFLTYVQKNGDVWALAVRDKPEDPRFEPLPVVDFLRRFADALVEYHTIALYLGQREDVLKPRLSTYRDSVGGTLKPFIQNGREVPGAQTIVGGRKVKRRCVDIMASSLIRYDQGQYRRNGELADSNLCYYAGSFGGNKWVKKPASFLKWAKNTLDWMRKHTPEEVPVERRPSKRRAILGVAAAHREGLKLF